MRFQIYQDEQKLWRWRIVSENGRIIGDSGEGYASKANVKRIIKRIIEDIRFFDDLVIGE